MFKKENRLPRGQSFRNSRIITTPFFKSRITKNRLLIYRYGFVVSKKIDKKAVVRNRIKRRLRAQIEKLKDEMKNGYDLLFIAKKELKKEENKDLSEEIKKLFVKEGIIK